MQKENTVQQTAFMQRETFISTINHDLKVPVIAQIRALELLIDEKMGLLNSNQKEILSLTLDSCRSIYGMLSEIISAYKYENKDIVLELENINLLRIIENYFTQSKNLIRSRNINILVFNNSFYPNIIADKHQIQKAFEYLANYCISCASKDTELICEIKDSEEFIHLSLTFECPDFSYEKTKNLFNSLPEHRMDKVGCSLGIYLAKQIITAHNGYIDFSNSGIKNTYTINLPLNNVNNMTKLQ